MKKIAMILIAFATIGGCATFSNNSSWVWVGETSAELLADWGTPSDQVDMTDGGSVWTYYENVVGNRIDANNIPKLGATKIEFVVNALGIITNTTQHGVTGASASGSGGSATSFQDTITSDYQIEVESDKKIMLQMYQE